MKIQLHFEKKYDKPERVMVLLESPGEIARFIQVLGGENLNLSTLLGQMTNIRGFIDTIAEDIPE